MFHRLLVPLDGSPTSARILYYIERWFSPQDVVLELVRVVPPYRHSLASTDTLMPVAVAHQYEEAQNSMQQVAGELREKGYTVNVHILEGTPSLAIKSAADRLEVDAIAMTTHGRTGLARALLGSVAEDLIKHAHHPIFLVRMHPEMERHAEIRRILVPLDGSDISERELPYATGLAKQFGAALYLLEVVEHRPERELDILPHHEGEEHEATLGVAKLYLERHAEKLRAQELPVEIVLKMGKAAPEIVKVAYENDIDLIVMSTHGYTGFSELVLGSVTREVLRTAPCPLLVLPPKLRQANTETQEQSEGEA